MYGDQAWLLPNILLASENAEIAQSLMNTIDDFLRGGTGFSDQQSDGLLSERPYFPWWNYFFILSYNCIMIICNSLKNNRYHVIANVLESKHLVSEFSSEIIKSRRKGLFHHIVEQNTALHQITSWYRIYKETHYDYCQNRYPHFSGFTNAWIFLHLFPTSKLVHWKTSNYHFIHDFCDNSLLHLRVNLRVY